MAGGDCRLESLDGTLDDSLPLIGRLAEIDRRLEAIRRATCAA
jgi:hypothetical protein